MGSAGVVGNFGGRARRELVVLLLGKSRILEAESGDFNTITVIGSPFDRVLVSNVHGMSDCLSTVGVGILHPQVCVDDDRRSTGPFQRNVPLVDSPTSDAQERQAHDDEEPGKTTGSVAGCRLRHDLIGSYLPYSPRITTA